jgi:hypothetical protein
VTDNQAISVTQQLDAGIRFLQGQVSLLRSILYGILKLIKSFLQTHKNVFGTLSMCHTSCWLNDAGSLESYLSTIKSWLDANPSQVITLLLTNGDGVGISSFGDAFSSSGLSNYAYSPGSTLSMDQWPTLQQLIDSGNRLVVFLGIICRSLYKTFTNPVDRFWRRYIYRVVHS